jgi:predicted AAA+ superfamily ATPase
MKNIYDRYPSLHVVFTGSSLLQVDFSMADLSRRTVFYTLQGLSFREFLMFEGCEELPAYPLEQLLAEHTRMASGIVPHTSVIPLFEKYLRYGYYPFYKEAIESYTLRLQQVVTVILENDLPAVEKVEYASIRKMRHLLVVLSQMVPYTLNATKMGALVGTTRQQVVRMFEILERAALLIVLHSGKGNLRQLAKPEKIYLENANLMFSLSSTPDTGTVRETFFANQLKQAHTLAAPERGDFLVDDSLLFEVGGKTKTFEQIKDIPNSYLAVDGVEYGAANRIPLWLFGLLY